MPNRILREGILTSDRVNALGPAAEVFYRRLMSVVDDYGRFDARPSVLRVSCYPLKVDSIREADISRSLAEVQRAGLIALYEVGGKPYLELQDFRQHVRATKSKYPDPSKCDATAPQMQRKCDAHTLGDEDGDGDEGCMYSARARETPKLEEVLERAKLIGVTADVAEMWFHSCESRPITPDGGWTLSNGKPMAMDRWQHALAAYSAAVMRNNAGRPNGIGAGKVKTQAQSKYVNEF